jgi:hypothetical protein
MTPMKNTGRIISFAESGSGTVSNRFEDTHG